MSGSLIPGSDGSGRSVSWRTIALIGLALPLVAATVLVWATTGRQDNLDRIPVAVVNNDRIIQDPQPMAAGRALAASLTQPSSDQTNLDWTLADTDDAAAGLTSGRYYAVLTIPPDFSQAILSTGTDDPVQGELQLVSNGAASSTVPFLSQAIASAAATSLGQQSTQAYLGQVYDGFNTIASSNEQTASSAQELAQGTQQVAQGAEQLDSGTQQLAVGLGELSDGAGQLADGTDSLRQGADTLAGGARSLASGAGDLDAGIDRLAGGAETLAGRQAGLARDARRVAAGSVEVAAAARRHALGSRGIEANLRALTVVCGRQGASAVFCAALARAHERAATVADGAAGVADRTADVARAEARLAAGTEALAAGSRGVADGARALGRAGQQVASGADDLATGAATVAQGSIEADGAAAQLAAGAASSSAAAQELASGSASLDAGASSADDGAQQLSQGLDQLAQQSPTYSQEDQDALTTVVSEPVTLTSTVEHSDHSNGWLIGVVIGIVLWLAALLGVLRRDIAHVLRFSTTPVSSRRLTMVQVRPALALALAQALAVLAALLLLGTGMASPVSFGLLTAVAAVTFTLVGLALRWAWGNAGSLAFVLFLLLQAAALGNVLPIETAPEPLPTLNGLLPLTVYVNAASQLVSGGSVGSLAGSVTVLVVWGLGATVVSLALVRRRRVAPAPTAVAVAA